MAKLSSDCGNDVVPVFTLHGTLLVGLIGLSVVQSETLRYRCGGGEIMEASYGSLSDRSLSFVRLRLPEGRVLTPPQVASGSGARYRADHAFTWWSQGQQRLSAGMRRSRGVAHHA